MSNQTGLLSDHRILEILNAEPRLKPILDEAFHQQNGPDYDRILTYIHLRNEITSLVGCEAENPDLRNSGDYQLVLEIIIDLLPPDHLDLSYPPPPAYQH